LITSEITLNFPSVSFLILPASFAAVCPSPPWGTSLPFSQDESPNNCLSAAALLCVFFFNAASVAQYPQFHHIHLCCAVVCFSTDAVVQIPAFRSATGVRKMGDRKGRIKDALSPFRVTYLPTAVVCCSGVKSFLGGPLLTLRLLFCLSISTRAQSLYFVLIAMADPFVRSIVSLRFFRSSMDSPATALSCCHSYILPIDSMPDHHPCGCLYFCVGYQPISRCTSTSLHSFVHSLGRYVFVCNCSPPPHRPYLLFRIIADCYILRTTVIDLSFAFQLVSCVRFVC
jgi:hypothetical protein